MFRLFYNTEGEGGTGLPGDGGSNSQGTGGGEGEGGILGGAPDPEPVGGESESWHSGINETLLTEKVRRFESLDDFVESYNNAQGLISQKGLEPPGTDATEEDLAEFYEKIGRPESPDKYEWDPPDGIDVDEDRLKEYKAELHKAGVRPEQFKKIMGIWAKEEASRAEAEASQAAISKDQTERELRNLWGEDYMSKLGRAKIAANTLGLMDVLKRTGLDSSAEVIYALAEKVAPTISEDKAIGGAEKENLSKQLDALESQLMSADPNHPGYGELINKRSKLIMKLSMQ